MDCYEESEPSYWKHYGITEMLSSSTTHKENRRTTWSNLDKLKKVGSFYL